MKTKPWRLGWSLSLALHAALALAAMFAFLDRMELPPPPADSSAPSGGGGASAAPPDMRNLLAAQERQIADLSDAQKMRALEDRLRELERIAPRDVDAIARMAESIHEVDAGRQYAPVAGVAGEFDADSATIHDIEKKTAAGRTVYEYTLVDKDGRAMTTQVDEKDMTGADLASYNVFRMAKGNPSLRRLVDAAVRIGESRLSKEPPATAPAPP